MVEIFRRPKRYGGPCTKPFAVTLLRIFGTTWSHLQRWNLLSQTLATCSIRSRHILTEVDQGIPPFPARKAKMESAWEEFRRRWHCLSCPRRRWPTSRILDVYTNTRDGYVRRVTVQTKGSILQRPIDKIVFLEPANWSRCCIISSHSSRIAWNSVCKLQSERAIPLEFPWMLALNNLLPNSEGNPLLRTPLKELYLFFT